MPEKCTAVEIKRTILLLYGIDYCHPDFLGEYFSAARKQPGGFPPADLCLQEACEYIAAFHLGGRPQEDVQGKNLYHQAADAVGGKDPAGFQIKLTELVNHPARSRKDRRIHSKRGCQLCAAPCRYGYFSLLVEPDFEPLFLSLKNANTVPDHSQHPVQLLWNFTLRVLVDVYGGGWTLHPVHLGNLSYCLLSLATAKSRYPFPESSMGKLQTWNQLHIRQFVE